MDLEYPRMLFHPRYGSATVRSQSEEQALGPGWSRTFRAQQPTPDPDEEEEEQEPEESDKPADPTPTDPKPKSVKRYAHR